MEKAQKQPDSSGKNNSKKSIFDIFRINLARMPDDNFIEGAAQLEPSGDSINHYYSCLDYLECDIFNVVKIVRYQNNFKNVFFKCYTLSKLNVSKVKALINSLYSIYGPDDNKKGEFSQEDLKDFNSDESYMFFGRRWIEDKFEYPVAIEINRETNVITLSILGMKIKLNQSSGQAAAEAESH